MLNINLDFDKPCYIYFNDGSSIKGIIIGFSIFIFSPDWIKLRTKNSLIHINTHYIKTISYHD